MANIPIFGKMGSRGVLAIGRYDLVHRPPFGELRIQLHAELAGTTRTCIATLDDGWINMFHCWLRTTNKEESFGLTGD
jgi:hypothetical protein